MTKPFHTLQEINKHRYSVVAGVGIRQHILCEIAQYEPINTWYLVASTLKCELSEQALKFIYEIVKRLNEEAT